MWFEPIGSEYVLYLTRQNLKKQGKADPKFITVLLGRGTGSFRPLRRFRFFRKIAIKDWMRFLGALQLTHFTVRQLQQEHNIGHRNSPLPLTFAETGRWMRRVQRWR
jgi:hypothetical protein